MSTKRFVACVDYVVQTGPDKWDSIRAVQVLLGGEYVRDVFDWARSMSKSDNPQVLILEDKGEVKSVL